MSTYITLIQRLSFCVCCCWVIFFLIVNWRRTVSLLLLLLFLLLLPEKKPRQCWCLLLLKVFNDCNFKTDWCRKKHFWFGTGRWILNRHHTTPLFQGKYGEGVFFCRCFKRPTKFQFSIFTSSFSSLGNIGNNIFLLVVTRTFFSQKKFDDEN